MTQPLLGKEGTAGIIENNYHIEKKNLALCRQAGRRWYQASGYIKNRQSKLSVG
jgi:hypothetical protein